MASIENLIETVEAVAPDAQIHTFLSSLQAHGAVPVIDGKKIIGMVFVDDVSRREYPVTSKASTAMTRVSSIDAKSDVVEAAAALMRLRGRALPVTSAGSYVGIVAETAVMRAVSGVNKRVEEVMNEPVTITDDANVGKARSTLRDQGIGKLPVVNRNGDLVGVVDWQNFVVLEKPKESMGRRDQRGDYLQDSKIDVTAVMDESPLTVERGTSVVDAAKKMDSRKCTYAIVVDGKAPVGIITCEDILELLAALVPREGVYVQITGAEDLDSFDRDKLHSNVDETVRKLARIYAGIEYFVLRLKKHETQGSKTKFSVQARLMTPVGVFRAHAHGYDLAAVTDKAMDNLERIVKEDHSKKKKQMRKRSERAQKRR
ncbi:MAG: CBS domain-containing protein [Candidatus Aenigmatarchaeota archaeon]|nr:MAG: CBS domain-containing protein [Candidatus Aenigmarchaeota archaeon]